MDRSDLRRPQYNICGGEKYLHTVHRTLNDVGHYAYILRTIRGYAWSDCIHYLYGQSTFYGVHQHHIFRIYRRIVRCVFPFSVPLSTKVIKRTHVPCCFPVVLQTYLFHNSHYSHLGTHAKETTRIKCVTVKNELIQ